MTSLAKITIALSSILLATPGCESSSENTPAPRPLMISATVGASGATLTSSDGRLQMAIPPGALTSDTDITIEEVAAADADPAFGDGDFFHVFDVTPAGQDFAQPVTFNIEIPRSAYAKYLPARSKEEQTFIEIEGRLVPIRAINIFDEDFVMPDVQQTVDGEGMNISFEQTRLFKFSLDDLGVGLDAANAIMFVLGEDEVEVEKPWGLNLAANLDGSMPSPWFVGMQSGDNVESLTEFPEDGAVLTAEVDPDTGRDVYNFSFDLQFATTDPEVVSFDMETTLDVDDPAAFGVPDGVTSPRWNLVFKSGSLTLQATACEVNCGSASDLSVPLAMQGVRSVRVGHSSQTDAPPPEPGKRDANDPWLYVAGAGGLEYFELARDAAGQITGHRAIDFNNTVNNIEGVVPMSFDVQSEFDPYAVLYYSDAGASRSQWNGTAYGASFIFINGPPVKDAVQYGGTTGTSGAVTCNNSSSAVIFLEIDPVSGIFSTAGGALFGSEFDGRTGNAVSAFANGPTSGAIVVTDGSPGQIWTHSRSDKDDGNPRGVVQNDPRQVRAQSGRYAVSNHGSNSISTGTWDGGTSLSPPSSSPVGTGPIGVEMLALADGNVAVLTASEVDGAATVTILGPSGNVVGTPDTILDPAGCGTTSYAAWIGGPVVYIAFPCARSGTIELVATSYIAELR